MNNTRPGSSDRSTLEQALEQETPLLMDGAIGTQLLDCLNSKRTCLEVLNIEQPERVSQLHRTYIQAGARVLSTNTFGANTRSLGDHGLAEDAKLLARCGGQIALAQARAADRPCYVLGSLGPGAGLPCRGELSSSEICASLRPAIAGLLEAEVDGLLFETLRDPDQALAATQALQQVAGAIEIPVVLSFHPEADGSIASGHGPTELWRLLEDCAPLVFAYNCGDGPEPLNRALAPLAQLPAGPRLGAWANAGLPGAHSASGTDPAAFAHWCLESSKRFGLALVGGCCGSGPEHVRAAARALSPA